MIAALPPLSAETIYQIGQFPITNTYVNTTLAVLFFAIISFFVFLKTKKYYKKNLAPKGFLNFVEWNIETIFSYLDQVTGDRKKSSKFLPIVGSLFIFILISNWMGLLPGTSSFTIVGELHGNIEKLPVLRPGNTDLNMTLAMAVFAVVFSHILGVVTIGFFKYTNKFIKFLDIWTAVKTLNPTKILVAIIEFFVGLIEIISEIAKMLSLSLRLYGNIFAGEVLLTVLASLIAGYGAFFIPLPFIALELLVGLIQATVFSMLTLVYLNMAVMKPHGENEQADH